MSRSSKKKNLLNDFENADLLNTILKLINNSSSLDKARHDRGSVWMFDLNIDFYDFILHFLHSFTCDWEDVSNTQDSVWSHF